MMFLQQELYLTLVPQRNTQSYRGIISVTQNTWKNEDVSCSLIGNMKDGLSLGPGPLLGRSITGNGIVVETSIKYQVLPYFTSTSAFQGHCYSCWLASLLTHAFHSVSSYSQWPFQSTPNMSTEPATPRGSFVPLVALPKCTSFTATGTTRFSLLFRLPNPQHRSFISRYERYKVAVLRLVWTTAKMIM